MRIAIFTDYPPYKEKGGAEIRLHRLTKSLAERGHEVHVFCGDKSSYDKTIEGVKYHVDQNHWEGLPIGVRNAVYVFQTYWRFLFKQIEGFDVVDAYRPLRSADISSFAGFGAMSFKTCRFLKKLILLTLIPLQYIFYKLSDESIATSRAVKRALRNIYGDGRKIHVVYSGVDKIFRTTEKISTERFTVCSTKNPRTVIEVAQNLRDARFEILGEEVDSDLSNVEVHGRVSHEKVLQLMRRADVYFHPTTADSASMSTREAMMIGLPVVATEVGGIKDLIIDGFNGLFVEPGDIGEMTSKIRYLKDNKEERDRLGRNAKRTTESRFDWNTFVKRIEKIYQERI